MSDSNVSDAGAGAGAGKRTRKPKSVARQAADLADKVRRLRDKEEEVVEQARLKHRAKMARMVASAPEDVQRAFYALVGGDES